MSTPFTLKPTHKAVRAYYLALSQLANVGAAHESAVRAAFDQLIEAGAGPLGWTLVREYALTRKGTVPLKLDGALLDTYRLVHGVIEAKDDADDLKREMVAKLKLGYPGKNILFWQPRRAILVQDGKVVLDFALDSKPDQLVELLEKFFSYIEPVIADWARAAEEFKERVAELGASLGTLIRRARGAEGTQPNKKFVTAFNDFTELCRAAINPGLSVEAVEEMLIQHLLTARLFTSVFRNPDFTRRNVVAIEIEKVIEALASGHFDRADFLKKLDRFYLAIEHAAATLDDFSEKQKFLNTVYEKFFQGFAVKVADTMGIVYTPPSIVNFMIESIRELLKKEFGKGLGDEGVHFLDPFTGTGNFLVHLLRALPKTALRKKYLGELWANEIMLLPYYIAALNLEHEYFEATGEYEPFPGLCLVDTFELAEPRDTEFEFMTAANTERVNAQKKAPIRVILGNPPYNANQQDENDNNKNRKYPRLDQRIKNTYAADSKATLLNKLSDPYIKSLRWASDRIGEEGVVALVTNNGFIQGLATDGMRKHLTGDFDAVYIIDLGGNSRKSQMGVGNVFGIRVGVSINIFVRKPQKTLKPRSAKIHYFALDDMLSAKEKLGWLEKQESIENVKWRILTPDARNTWVRDGLSASFDGLTPIGNKETKALDSLDAQSIFRTYSLGISTNRDGVVYDFDRDRLLKRVEDFCDDYNSEVLRWKNKGRPDDIDHFVRYEKIKWSRNLKGELKRENYLKFNPKLVRTALYRPYSTRQLYFADIAIDEPSKTGLYFTEFTKGKNKLLCVTDAGSEKPFMALVSDSITDLHMVGSGAGCQCFPLYTYDSDGGSRRDNVTDWALAQFKARYPLAKVTKAAIFHYVYAVLHHPQYHVKYAANLRRELPRIPFADDFAALAKAGEKLAALHTGYEDQKPYKLKHVETPGAKLDLRVERMKLSKDKASLVYNDYLTLTGIPESAHAYRLGNRSALEWVIDQYRVERDEKGEITSDPNRGEDAEYILRLVGQVVAVSVETMKLVAALPALEKAAGYTQAEADAAHVYMVDEEAP
jgi:predicted helicase